MQYGLHEQTLAKIISCLKSHTEVRWVKIYGSRAMGNFKKGSDIDLAYSSKHEETATLFAELDGLSTPYLFDVTHYESIENKKLIEHIDRVGKIIYSKTILK